MSDGERTTARGGAQAERTTSARDRLVKNKERVLSRWAERLRQQSAAARAADHPLLIDTLPLVLDQLAEALAPDHPRRTATEGSSIAHEHGGERARLTRFGLDEIIAEYALLRQVLFEILEEDGPLGAGERRTLNVSLDQAIREACTGYALTEAGFRDQLFATIAHDLRNPLNAAQAYATLIKRHPRGDDVARWADRVVAHIGRVDRMVQDLLNAMRMQAGARLPLAISACDLVEIARDTIERLRAEHGDRFVLVSPEHVHGFFDPDALQRALENLTDNALKYGTPSRAITVTIREAHGRVIVSVHNDGAHIPAEKRESLFRAFERLTEAEESGTRGWGLGLSQVRAVAEAHGGSIDVDSLPKRGTTFTLDIPLDARPYQG